MAPGELAVEADKIMAERDARLKAAAIARTEREVPNRICYAEEFKNWRPGIPVPHCRRCDAQLFPEENHKCPVKLGIEEFKPKYEVWTDERKERAEARRQAIREADRIRRENDVPRCSVCGEEIPEFEDGQWHWDNHEGVPERELHAMSGEPDGDLDGYEDYDDGDYCEGDDDGWDCD